MIGKLFNFFILIVIPIKRTTPLFVGIDFYVYCFFAYVPSYALTMFSSSVQSAPTSVRPTYASKLIGITDPMANQPSGKHSSVTIADPRDAEISALKVALEACEARNSVLQTTIETHKYTNVAKECANMANIKQLNKCIRESHFIINNQDNYISYLRSHLSSLYWKMHYDDSAILLQSIVRGFLARRLLARHLLARQNLYTIRIQSKVRGFLTRLKITKITKITTDKYIIDHKLLNHNHNHVDENDKKDNICEKLYTYIDKNKEIIINNNTLKFINQFYDNNITPKITGMLRELDFAEMQNLLANKSDLDARINEASMIMFKHHTNAIAMAVAKVLATTTATTVATTDVVPTSVIPSDDMPSVEDIVSMVLVCINNNHAKITAGQRNIPKSERKPMHHAIFDTSIMPEYVKSLTRNDQLCLIDNVEKFFRYNCKPLCSAQKAGAYRKAKDNALELAKANANAIKASIAVARAPTPASNRSINVKVLNRGEIGERTLRQPNGTPHPTKGSLA